MGARGAAQQYSTLRAARAVSGIPYPRRGLASVVAIAADHASDHARGVCRGCRGRHRSGAIVQPVKRPEYSLFPYAVILQVTPVIAIAPLLLIYLPQRTAVIVCAWIVGFFPVLSNTTLGLNSVDRNLAGLFQLYGASRLQTLRYLKLPSALPFILGGLR